MNVPRIPGQTGRNRGGVRAPAAGEMLGLTVVCVLTLSELSSQSIEPKN